MAALGWWPHTIEGCTGIPQPLVAEIVNRYYATGQVTPPVQNFPAGPGAPQGGYYMAAPVAEMPNVGVPTGYGQPQATRAASPAPLESSPEPEPEPAPQLEECSTELEDFHVEYLQHYIRSDPSVTLKNLCEVLLAFKVAVSQFKLFRTLRQNGIEIQNTEDRPELNKLAREEYSYLVGAFEPEQLVFVGQVACDVRYGWSVRGRARRARNQKFTICFGLSNSGIVTLRILESAANAETYRQFVKYTADYVELLPRPNSVLVLHSRLLRTEDEVVRTARSSGTPCLFLPRDSNDYNPIKQAVSAIKTGISKAHKSLGEADNKDSVEAIMFSRVFDLAQEHAEDWFQECGYT